jgi:hypothetical protein
MKKILHVMGSGLNIPAVLLIGWAAAAHFGFLDVRLWS